MYCKTAGQRAVRLTVVEGDRVLESIKNTRALKGLNGQQRQQLEDAAEQLRRAMERRAGRFIKVPRKTVIALLRCMALTQSWFEEMLAEFSVVDVD